MMSSRFYPGEIERMLEWKRNASRSAWQALESMESMDSCSNFVLYGSHAVWLYYQWLYNPHVVRLVGNTLRVIVPNNMDICGTDDANPMHPFYKFGDDYETPHNYVRYLENIDMFYLSANLLLDENLKNQWKLCDKLTKETIKHFPKEYGRGTQSKNECYVDIRNRENVCVSAPPIIDEQGDAIKRRPDRRGCVGHKTNIDGKNYSRPVRQFKSIRQAESIDSDEWALDSDEFNKTGVMHVSLDLQVFNGDVKWGESKYNDVKLEKRGWICCPATITNFEIVRMVHEKGSTIGTHRGVDDKNWNSD